MTELRHNVWPLQSECDEFYGNPRKAAWEQANLVQFFPPWKMNFEGAPIRSFKVHKKVIASLTRVTDAIWQGCGRSQEWVEDHHIDSFSGSYVFRNIRNSTRLSMHAYGIAIDFAAGQNGLGEPWHPNKGVPELMISSFEKEGWVWGGRWTGRPDAMHFQAARVAGAPALIMLSIGMSGPDVARLQEKLKMPADGTFGRATRQAVIRFQTAHGLEPDGVVGPETWKALG